MGDKIGTVPQAPLLSALFKHISFVTPPVERGWGHSWKQGPGPGARCSRAQCLGLVAWGPLGFSWGGSHTSTSHAETGLSTALRALQAGLHEGEKGLGLTQLGDTQKAS